MPLVIDSFLFLNDRHFNVWHRGLLRDEIDRYDIDMFYKYIP